MFRFFRDIFGMKIWPSNSSCLKPPRLSYSSSVFWSSLIFLCFWSSLSILLQPFSPTSSLTFFSRGSGQVSGSAVCMLPVPRAVHTHSTFLISVPNPISLPGGPAPRCVFLLYLPLTQVVPTSFFFLLFVPFSEARSLIEDAVTFPWAPSDACWVFV